MLQLGVDLLQGEELGEPLDAVPPDVFQVVEQQASLGRPGLPVLLQVGLPKKREGETQGHDIMLNLSEQKHLGTVEP